MVTEGPAVVLHGRRAEREVLDRLLAAVRGGQSRVLVVSGEPGVGKTALLQSVIESASGLRVARAVGVESEMELAFAALQQLCAPMLDRLDRLPAPQQEALGVAFGLSVCVLAGLLRRGERLLVTAQAATDRTGEGLARDRSGLRWEHGWQRGGSRPRLRMALAVRSCPLCNPLLCREVSTKTRPTRPLGPPSTEPRLRGSNPLGRVAQRPSGPPAGRRLNSRIAAVPFTLRNLKEDLEDLGSNFDGPPDLEFRHASKALELEQCGLSYQRIPPDYRFPYGHTHEEQEEVYVVVRGSGRMKLDDEIVEVKEWDVVRIPPGTWRGYEGGPQGLEILVFGAPNLGENPREDVEGQRDWWAD
jgi:quercetin dioxygenase-like cupin family protein